MDSSCTTSRISSKRVLSLDPCKPPRDTVFRSSLNGAARRIDRQSRAGHHTGSWRYKGMLLVSRFITPWRRLTCCVAVAFYSVRVLVCSLSSTLSSAESPSGPDSVVSSYTDANAPRLVFMKCPHYHIAVDTL